MKKKTSEILHKRQKDRIMIVKWENKLKNKMPNITDSQTTKIINNKLYGKDN